MPPSPSFSRNTQWETVWATRDSMSLLRVYTKPLRNNRAGANYSHFFRRTLLQTSKGDLATGRRTPSIRCAVLPNYCSAATPCRPSADMLFSRYRQNPALTFAILADSYDTGKLTIAAQLARRGAPGGKRLTGNPAAGIVRRSRRAPPDRGTPAELRAARLTPWPGCLNVCKL